jgi:hypothetical protein
LHKTLTIELVPRFSGRANGHSGEEQVPRLSGRTNGRSGV